MSDALMLQAKDVTSQTLSEAKDLIQSDIEEARFAASDLVTGVTHSIRLVEGDGKKMIELMNNTLIEAATIFKQTVAETKDATTKILMKLKQLLKTL